MKRYWTTPGGTYYNLYADMLKQTHLLIAGTTGSGKSVIINGIIHTALYKSPSIYQFILIDPKRVELIEYKDLPHTLLYASEPRAMLDALRAAVALIDNRYKQMQKQRAKLYNGSKIIIVIDELADLLTTQKREAKPLLQRIAQIGRASNVMLIGATQRPTNDIVGNSITVNFDARIGLRTRNAQESRNIISTKGCETLPRYGRGYYYTPERAQLVNVPMYTDAERRRIINHWTQHRKPRILTGRIKL